MGHRSDYGKAPGMRTPSKVKLRLLGASLFLNIIPLPFAGVIWAIVFTRSEFPLEQVALGTIVGVATFIVGVVSTATFWNQKRWRLLSVSLVTFLFINLGWLPVRWYQAFTTRPYERQDLVFETVEEPKADVSGIWNGTWINPKKSETESITLELIQEGNDITGTITADSTQFEIRDGQISGDEINLFYDHSVTEFSRSEGVGTLIGRVNEQQASGAWFAHKRPRFGYSRSGPWSIEQVKPPRKFITSSP